MAILPDLPKTGYYVYVLSRPDGRPFYVGKGKGQRVLTHLREAEKGCRCHKCNVIRKILREGGEIQYELVMMTADELEAFDYEQTLIAELGRENLCNATDGGEGASGRVLSEESRDKIRKRLLVHAEDPGFRDRMREQARLQWRTIPGFAEKLAIARQVVFDSPEWRAATAVRTAEQWKDDGIRERRMAGIKEYHEKHPEKAERVRQEAKNRWQDPAYREMMVNQAKDHRHSPESRAKIGAAVSARYVDPEAREAARKRARAQYQEPEARKKASDAQQRRFSDPDQRRIASEKAKARWARYHASKNAPPEQLSLLPDEFQNPPNKGGK